MGCSKTEQKQWEAESCWEGVFRRCRVRGSAWSTSLAQFSVPDKAAGLILQMLQIAAWSRKGISNVFGGRGQTQLYVPALKYTTIFCFFPTVCSRCDHCLCLSSAEVNSKSARVLFLLVIPGHLVFLYTIHLLQGGHTSLSFTFVMFYLTAALLQVNPSFSSKRNFLDTTKPKQSPS